MIRSIYKFRFSDRVPAGRIRDVLLLSTIAAESLHGTESLRVCGAYCLDLKARTFVVDAESQIGCDIARIFSGYLVRAIGSSNFDIRQTEGKIPNLPHYWIDGLNG